ncbi:MAG: HlyC/CorC family transporter [Myxococcales bacterium]|nr:HlyC/CorC family transporter [Myxococcales bacterium]
MSSLSGPRKAALREMLEGKNRAALERYIDQGQQIESRWLVFRVVGIATSAALLIQQTGYLFGAWSPLVAAMAAVLGYGLPSEVLKGVVLRAPERTGVWMLRFLRPLELLAVPLAAPMWLLGRVVGRRVVTVAQTIPPPRVTETEMEILVSEGEKAGAIDHDQAEMVRNVLEFGDLTAGQAMISRTRVTAFDIETDAEELLRRVGECGHSRYPVYRERIDNVVGILHAKDLLTHAAQHTRLETVNIEGILRRPVAFVPETQEASKVLKDMRAGRHHMAIVIDEFGGMSGIVTLEDLIEEIVGDIQDEHDVDEQSVVELGEGRFSVDASVSIVELNRLLNAGFPEDGDYNTVGGLLLERLGLVPEVGSKIEEHGFAFHVREADDRRVIRVEVERLATEKASETPKTSRVSAA